MEEDGVEVAQYVKGEFGFYLPTCWQHVAERADGEEESFVERYDCAEVGRLSVECLPLMTDDASDDAAEVLLEVEPGPGETAGPIVRLASGFVFRSRVHRDAEVAAFRWLHCEVAVCFEPGAFGMVRFSACTSEARLRDPVVLMHAHLIRVCARQTEVLE